MKNHTYKIHANKREEAIASICSLYEGNQRPEKKELLKAYFELWPGSDPRPYFQGLGKFAYENLTSLFRQFCTGTKTWAEIESTYEALMQMNYTCEEIYSLIPGIDFSDLYAAQEHI